MIYPFEAMCLGYAFGVLTSLAFIAIGICFGRNNKRKSNTDDNISVGVSDGNGNRKCHNGYNKRVDEEEIDLGYNPYQE